MKFSMKAHSVRSPVLAVAVTVALATGGIAYGSSSNDDPSSTAGAETGKAESTSAASVGGTAHMQPKRGVQSSSTTPRGSTASMLPGADQDPAAKARPRTDVDKSDRGKKGARATKDRGRKSASATND